MANSNARPVLVSPPPRTGRARWRAVLEACGRSGLTQAEFCRRRGIPPGTLSCWKHKLARARWRGPRAAAGGAGSARAAAPSAFVPVQLTAGLPPSGAGPAGGPPAWGGELEIVLAGGRRVRARGRVDPQWLGQVVRTLEMLGC